MAIRHDVRGGNSNGIGKAKAEAICDWIATANKIARTVGNKLCTRTTLVISFSDDTECKSTLTEVSPGLANYHQKLNANT